MGTSALIVIGADELSVHRSFVWRDGNPETMLPALGECLARPEALIELVVDRAPHGWAAFSHRPLSPPADPSAIPSPDADLADWVYLLDESRRTIGFRRSGDSSMMTVSFEAAIASVPPNPWHAVELAASAAEAMPVLRALELRGALAEFDRVMGIALARILTRLRRRGDLQQALYVLPSPDARTGVARGVAGDLLLLLPERSKRERFTLGVSDVGKVTLFFGSDFDVLLGPLDQPVTTNTDLSPWFLDCVHAVLSDEYPDLEFPLQSDDRATRVFTGRRTHLNDDLPSVVWHHMVLTWCSLRPLTEAPRLQALGWVR